MANTKNFVVKGPLEVGTTVVSNKGTATLSDVSSLTNATYENKSLNINATTQVPQGLFFKSDGTQAYVIDYSAGSSTCNIYTFTLSTAWDISTGSYTSSFSVYSDGVAFGIDLFFKPDGTKMYVLNEEDDSVYQYSLSTAWDLTTATYVSVSSSLTNSSKCFVINSAGTKVYVVRTSNSWVFEYLLSTPWDITTASYSGNSLSLASETTFAASILLKSDETSLYVLDGGSTDSIYEYTMTTAGSLSTASYSGNSFSVNSRETIPRAMFFKSDDLTMYVLGQASDTIDQYSISRPSIICDLSTGNLFEASTDSPNQLVTFNNASDAQSFNLELTNNTRYNLSSLSLLYNRTSWPFTYDYFGIHGFQISYDGKKIWYNSSWYNYIREASLATAFDLSTVGNVTTGYNYAGGGYALTGFHVTEDGYCMFSGAHTPNKSVLKFNLSTANAVSTATIDQTLDLSSDVSNAVYGVTLKPDGTEMYVSVRDAGISGSNGYYIFQYSLSTAFDLSTATYTNYVNPGIFSYAFSFSADGTFLMFSYGAQLRKYVLSTAWDISTATLDLQITVPTITASTLLSCVDPKGLYVYAFQDAGGTGQGPAWFDIRGTVDLTFPSSVKTQNGSALSGLLGSESGTYSFSTTDGGATYQGVKTLQY